MALKEGQLLRRLPWWLPPEQWVHRIPHDPASLLHDAVPAAKRAAIEAEVLRRYRAARADDAAQVATLAWMARMRCEAFLAAHPVHLPLLDPDGGLQRVTRCGRAFRESGRICPSFRVVHPVTGKPVTAWFRWCKGPANLVLAEGPTGRAPTRWNARQVVYAWLRWDRAAATVDAALGPDVAGLVRRYATWVP